MPHTPLSECSLCRDVPQYVYVDYLGGGGEQLPGGLQKLIGSTQGYGMYENVSRCPECGTYYMNTNETGFGENDIEVKRVSPTRAGIIVADEDRVQYEKELEHSDQSTRIYAAQCLADEAVARDDQHTLERLFSHTDPKVRMYTALALLGREDAKYADIMLRVTMDDPDMNVKINTVRYFNYNAAAVECSLDGLAALVESSVSDSVKSILQWYSRQGHADAVRAALHKHNVQWQPEK